MKRFKKFPFLLVCILVVILTLNNTIYYFNTKKTLENEMINKMISNAQQINISLERSRQGAHFVENVVGDKLRGAAIAIREKLDPNIENVANEELDLLAKELNLNHITLLKKTENDIVLYKSSYRKEIGVSTKKWGLWYQAFNELFASKNVTMKWGQSLENFWAGPYSVSVSNSKDVNKYGYYYDGTTNYLINPFVTNQVFKDYESQVGMESIIKDTQKLDSSILEVSGINPSAFGSKTLPKSINNVGEEFTSRYYFPIFFGTYNYKSEEKDNNYIQQAIAKKKPMSYKTFLNGKHVFKIFTPVFTDKIDDLMEIPEKSGEEYKTLNYYVMGITVDYNIIQENLNHTLFNLLLIIVVVTLALILILLAFNYYLNRTKDEAVDRTQATYIEEVNQLFNSIRGQRHDFLNHISTIHAFMELNKIDDLKRYTKELLGDVVRLNNIIEIGQPAIAALIQTKSVFAEDHHIIFTHKFENVGSFPKGVKSVDYVCIIGNLIDNAFESASLYPTATRNVELTGWIEGEQLLLTIQNPGIIPAAQSDIIFKSNYSTKADKKNHGLGLSIVSSIIKRYKGNIELNRSIDETIIFKVTLPL